MGSNPFSTRFITPGAIPFRFSDGTSVQDLVERLAHEQWCGQIVGPHGSGKSTLLATLTPALQAAGRSVVAVTLHQGEHRLPPLHKSKLSASAQLIIDGYEQLSWWSRWRVKMLSRRSGCGLLVTAHSAVGLATLYRTEASLAVAHAVAAELLKDVDAGIGDADVASAFAATGGNVRETLFRLFDVYQRRFQRAAS